MRVEIVQARLSHIEPLLDRLRDRERVAFATAGVDSYRTIAREMEQSHMSYAGLVDGIVVAIAGIRGDGLLGDVAYIWMIGNVLVEDHPVAFYRHTRRFIADLLNHYKTLYCWADADFVKSHQWLKWLGFVPTGSWNNAVMFRT